MIRITVRYFANLRERRGVEHETLEVEPGLTADQLFHRLFDPLGLGALPVAYAINHAYCSATRVLTDGDELVFIPPVGGG